MAEVRKFVSGLQNSKIVAVADIEELEAMCKAQRSQIELLGKFKEKCQGDFQQAISTLSKQIASL